MFNRLGRLKRAQRALASGGVLAGAVVVSLGLSVPAYASPAPSQNTLMIGSGSSTTYFMMQTLDTLFNNSPGCQNFDPTGQNQHLDFTCLNDPTALNPASTTSSVDNPYNDISVQESALGSSTGILQLENQGSLGASYKCKNGDPCPTSQVDYARSSRALKSSDQTGLNFVGYAKDGVDWVHFAALPPSHTVGKGKKKHKVETPTPSASVTNLTDAQIAGIWNGTINNWYQITNNPKDNAPICVYTAQDGSGTLATWDGYTGVTTENVIGTLTPNTSAVANAPKNSSGQPEPFVNAGCLDGTSASQYGATHQIFENETRQLIANGAAQTGSAKYADTADSIYFYSVGRYFNQCVSVSAICDPAGFKLLKGEIDGVTADQTTIIATDQPGYSGPVFPVLRYLYNVYSNGSNSNLAPANPAVVNYVSEIGFLCKPQTYTPAGGGTPVSLLDPNTGVPYETEIADTIQSYGFFRLPLQAQEDQGTIPHPAATLLPKTGTGSAYSYYDPMSTAVSGGAAAQQTTNLADVNPSGYCKVFTTG